MGNARAAGAESQALAYATAELTGAPVWLYASVVDGATGGPTTIPGSPMP